MYVYFVAIIYKTNPKKIQKRGMVGPIHLSTKLKIIFLHVYQRE